MKPQVFVLTTGGTISHRSRTDGVAVMDFGPEGLLAETAAPGIDVIFKPVLHKGSMDIGPEDWRTIAIAIAELISNRPRGIVVLHGTDTMHYTAAALSFMLQGLDIPVVLTGSMKPGGDPQSDSLPNMRDAIRVAAFADIAEVCIVFSADAKRTRGWILRGNRARKMHSCAIDAFDTVNFPPLGYIDGDKIAVVDAIVSNRHTGSELRLATSLDPNVVFVKANPAMTPKMLSRCLGTAAAAVIEGTGVGHIRTELQPVVADFAKPTVFSTQAIYGGERLGLYEVDRHVLNIPNVIPAGGMTGETALVKLMWALRQGDRASIRSIMQRNLAGELSEHDYE